MGALFISTLFEPMIVFAMLAVCAGIRAGLPVIQWRAYGGVLFLFILFIALIRFILVRKHIVSNWDVSVRKERVVPLLMLTISIGVFVAIIRMLGNDTLSGVFLVFFVWIIGFFGVNLFYKISGHMGAMTLLVACCIYWFGFFWLPIVALIPLVGWSRVVLKRHTVGQVAGAVVYSVGVFFLAVPTLL